MRISRGRLAIFMAILPVVCPAQQLKVKEQSGHVSPFRARITFLDDRTREVVVSAIGSEMFTQFYTHAFFVRTEGGASKRTVWIDQIAAIRDLSQRSRNPFTIQLKNGTSFDALFVAGYGMGQCDTLPEISADNKDDRLPCSWLVIANPDESTEHINMLQLKSVEFLPPARKDKAGNFMFDTWQFSPFTGEKLPAR